MRLNRRDALISLAAAPGVLSLMSNAQNPPKRPPHHPRELVGEFVGASHGRFERVQELLAEHPTLLNATYDWGGGDFESAIGAAGHVGHKEIAKFLIEKGARTDIFVHTMLGDTAIVKPMLDRYPATVHTKGPHGISLLRHAQAGGEDAEELKELIESLVGQAN